MQKPPVDGSVMQQRDLAGGAQPAPDDQDASVTPADRQSVAPLPGDRRRAPVATPPSGSRTAPLGLFVLETLYLIVLLASAIAYNGPLAAPFLYGPLHALFPTPAIGPIPLAVPWFGALGAVLIGLFGIFQHQRAWDDGYDYWHVGRPLTGAALGVVAYMIFRAVIEAAGGASGAHPATTPFVYEVVAFLVGFREHTFMLLIQRATDVILGPGDTSSSPPPSISPAQKGAAGAQNKLPPADVPNGGK